MTNDKMTNDYTQINNLLFSCFCEKQRGHEQFVPEHSLGYIISGDVHLQTNEGLRVLNQGSIGIIRRNHLVKSVKVPPPGGEFKSINIFLGQDFLRRYGYVRPVLCFPVNSQAQEHAFRAIVTA